MIIGEIKEEFYVHEQYVPNRDTARKIREVLVENEEMRMIDL